MDSKQRELMEFLKRRVFDPVMRADGSGRSDAEKRRLKDVKDATRSEIDRYEHYESAQELVTNFERDLHSDPAEKIQRECKQLGLPILPEVREEFERKARDLGLNP
jgi:transcription initiation factor TFIIIB Brf1 subunit/transcription initiation factor TFIIB